MKSWAGPGNEANFRPCMAMVEVVLAPDPNPPQHGSHLVSPRMILDVIRAGVGLGLGPRLWLKVIIMVN